MQCNGFRPIEALWISHRCLPVTHNNKCFVYFPIFMILLNDNKSLNTQMCANDLNNLKIFNVYAFTDLGASIAKFRQVRDKTMYAAICISLERCLPTSSCGHRFKNPVQFGPSGDSFIRHFHKNTKLAIMALMQTLCSNFFLQFSSLFGS